MTRSALSEATSSRSGTGSAVPRPQPFEIENGEAASRVDQPGRVGADDAVPGRGHEGQRETVGVELPGDVDVTRVTGPARREDRHLVEPVAATADLAHPDLGVRHV